MQQHEALVGVIVLLQFWAASALMDTNISNYLR